jgi:putative oxidoreductase
MHRQYMLNALALLGRILLATLFVWSGLAKVFAPSATAAFMASGGLPASETLVVLVGLFEFLFGLALGVGIQTRVTAFSLAAFTLLASFLYHAYWAVGADQQAVQQLLFTKNMALAGALLFIGVIGTGYGRLVVYSNSLMSGPHGASGR